MSTPKTRPAFLTTIAAFFWLLLTSTAAHATTPAPGPGEFRVCLKADMTNLVDRHIGTRATNDTWTAYGIRFRVEKSGSVVQNWTYADANDGCFILNSGGGSYKIKVRPQSTYLDGGNTVLVRDASGTIKTFAVTTPWIGSNQTTYEVVLPSKAILRIYTVLAFAIERAFQGNFYLNDLEAWKGGTAPCATSSGTLVCTQGAESHIQIASDDHTRKFVIAHEYGHVNMRRAIGGRDNDCHLVSVDDDPPNNPPYAHRPKGREASSCAANEGYAHFVAGDIFNWHNSGTGSSNPQAEVSFRNTEIWQLGRGTGGCPSTYPLDGKGYPFDHARRQYVDCSPGTLEPWYGTPMDWARLWWDYHEDTDKPGSVRTHYQLHLEVQNAGPWGAYDAYSTVSSGLSNSTQQSRWANAADYNGVCDGGSC